MSTEHRGNFEYETIRDDGLMKLFFSVISPPHGLTATHWHNHMELLFMLEDGMEANINETGYQLRPGDVLIVNPKDLHNTTAYQTSCRYCLLQIPPVHLECIDADWQLLHFTEYIPFCADPDSESQTLCRLFQKLMQIAQDKQPGYRLLFLSEIYRLLYLLYEKNASSISTKSQRRTERDFRRIEQSMQFVKKNYRRSFSLDEVAGTLSIAPEYFCRLFKKMTGQTFFAYVNQIRLLHFYQDLLQTDESITYLMEKNGISNYKVFIREFKKAYGATPHRLRAENRL